MTNVVDTYLSGSFPVYLRLLRDPMNTDVEIPFNDLHSPSPVMTEFRRPLIGG